MSDYALIVIGKKVKAQDGSIMTEEGQLFWVVNETEGWVPATSLRCIDINYPPGDVKTFKTNDEACKFAMSWEGHPWWCVPTKTFKTVKLVPKMVTVQQGWKVSI